MSRVINILTLVMLVIVSAGVTYWFANKQQLVFKRPSEQILPKLEEKNFEEVLNNFLRDVDANADAYRKQRRIPADLIKPENLKTPQYITENAALMEDTIRVQREKMTAVMDVFGKTDEKINLLLVGKPDDQVNSIREQWQNLKDKQMASYVDFFSFEDDSIEVYQELMTLYTTHVATLHYDATSNQIVFDDPAVQQQEKDLRVKLLQIAQEQILSVRSDNKDGASPTPTSEAAPADVIPQPATPVE